MKIAIDVSQVVYETGVSEYTRNLVKALLEVDKKNDYVLFGGSLRRMHELRAFFSGLSDSADKRTLPIPPALADILFNRIRLGKIEMFTGDIDVFHSSDWSQPATDAFKVTTVHDMVPIIYPEQSHPKLVDVHKRRLDIVIGEVDTIIAPSESTKKDLIGFGAEESRIRVIPEAPDINISLVKTSEIDKIKAKFNIENDYILAVGAAKRKNIERIVNAAQKLKKSKDISLVVIGHPFVEIKKGEGIKVLGHVDNNEYSALLSGAECLVYPSLYEGFGLPILHAFKLECPVVTSNLGSMKEVAGNAAVLVDPKDGNDILEGIKKALNERKTLVKMGKERVKDFSWRKNAKQTIKVYDQSRR
jgi:glycosyltransferase involved in cell wall biosynthesis